MPRPESLPVTLLLAACIAFLPLSTDLYLPSLPELTRVFEADVADVQLTLSVFLVGFAVAQLVYGPMSDRFGRRPVLIGGLGLYFLASLACALAPNIEALVAARLFQAIGACSAPVLGRAIVRDVHGRERAAKILAYMGTAMALAPAVGPILGGYMLIWFGWRANFVLLAGFGGLVLVGVLFMLRETNRWRDGDALRAGRMLRNYRILLGSRVYAGYVLANAFVYSGLFAFISGSSFALIDYLGVAPERFGLFFGVIVAGYMAGTVIAGRLTLRAGLDRMILAGAAVATLAGAAMAGLALAGVKAVAAIIGPQFLFMAGVGMVMPNSMAGAIGPFPRMAGLASALLGFAQMALAALVGIAVGVFHDGTPLSMAVAIAASGAATLASFRLLVRPAGAVVAGT